MAAAIIVAAGCGRRMRSSVAKQFLEVGGVPILVRTLRVFARHPDVSQMLLVVPDHDMDFCRNRILPEFEEADRIRLVAGGKRRQDSVYNGLKRVDLSAGIVLIHDGVRPFVSPELISACISCARQTGACIAGIPASDTVKRVGTDNTIRETIAREQIWLAQTPQAFRHDLIREAFDRAEEDGYSGTDDASLVERMGHPVRLIEGSWRNIKITMPADMELAAHLLAEASG